MRNYVIDSDLTVVFFISTPKIFLISDIISVEFSASEVISTTILFSAEKMKHLFETVPLFQYKTEQRVPFDGTGRYRGPCSVLYVLLRSLLSCRASSSNVCEIVFITSLLANFYLSRI